MPAQDSPRTPQPEAAPDTTFTLESIRTDGPDALDNGDSQKIKDIILRKLELVRRNAFYEVNTSQAHDLFAPPAADHDQDGPIPTGATPIAATLAFHFTDGPGTDTAEIRPPNTLKLNSPTHAPAILAWLSKSCLNAAKKLARLAVILLAATVTACGPAFDDDDDDDDDDADSDDYAFCAHHPAPRFTHLSSIALAKEDHILTI